MSKRKPNDEVRDLSRRSLFRWTLAAGAALGVSRSNIFGILDKTLGDGMAHAAESGSTMRSIHIVAGNGGLAWFQLVWPHHDVAVASNPNSAWHKPGEGMMLAGTDKPFFMGPDTPWASMDPKKQMSMFMAGQNQTHTGNPDSTRTADGNSIFAIAAALQTTNPSVIPVIALDDVAFGAAPGAPAISRVASNNDIVGLFNSAASRAGGIIDNTADADLYRAHFDTFASLNRAATRSTTQRAYNTARSAATFLGTNLANALQVTEQDRMRYGIDGGTRAAVRDLGESMIIAVKAFAMGLTSSLIVPIFRDDPHGAFNDMGNLNNTASGLKKVFDGLIADLADKTDGITGQPLSSSVMLTINGDTPKTPLQRNGWPDGTPGNSNWVYVWGNGFLKSGWHGGIDRGGATQGYDPATGNNTAFNGQVGMRGAAAAVAYAVSRGDSSKVSSFVNVDYQGIIRPTNM